MFLPITNLEYKLITAARGGAGLRQVKVGPSSSSRASCSPPTASGAQEPPMPPSRTDSRSRKAVKHTLTDPEDSDDELRKKSRTMTKEFAGGKGKGKGKAKQGEGAESGLEEENSSGDGEAAAKVSAKGKGKAAAPVNPSTAKGGSKTKTKAATAPKKVTTARRQKKLPKEAGHLAGGGDVAPHGVLTGAVRYSSRPFSAYPRR